MKALIAILIVAVLLYLANALVKYYQRVEHGGNRPTDGQVAPGGASLSGLHPTLEPALEEAKKQGAASLKNFLKSYGYAIRDPRLADIQLDYVVLVSRQDLAEAKRVFQEVKARTPASSPVYARVKRLENSFQ